MLHPQKDIHHVFFCSVLGLLSCYKVNQEFKNFAVSRSIHFPFNPDQVPSPLWRETPPQHNVATTKLHRRYGVFWVVYCVFAKHSTWSSVQKVQSWSHLTIQPFATWQHNLPSVFFLQSTNETVAFIQKSFFFSPCHTGQLCVKPVRLFSHAQTDQSQL